MVKRVVLTVVTLLLVAAARPVYNIGVVFDFWPPLTRPSGVPASAHYVSMVEEGTWFDCSVDSKRNVDICKAWDPDGRLIANGNFRLQGEDRAATTAELKPTLARSGVGRAYIYLDGREGAFSKTLVQIDDRHPHSYPCKWVPATNNLICD